MALDGALPLMTDGGVVVFVTSHWAHLYGQVEQIPAYEPVAESKHAGEVALRARMDELAARGIRLIVVTGDLIEGTITPKLLERTSPGLEQDRRSALGAAADRAGDGAGDRRRGGGYVAAQWPYHRHRRAIRVAAETMKLAAAYERAITACGAARAVLECALGNRRMMLQRLVIGAAGRLAANAPADIGQNYAVK